MSASHATSADVAFDIGGTSIKCLTVTPESVLEVRTAPTFAHRGPEASLETVLQEVENTIAAVDPNYRIVGVGVASPGIVDEDRGVCLTSQNLGWNNVTLRDLLSQRTGLPVVFGHDVRAGGLAEWYMDAGRCSSHQAYLSLGTGISCALILDGVAILVDGHAGEIGHGGAPRGDPCLCGGYGCAETYASAAAMARRYTRLSGIQIDGARGLFVRLQSGDALARQVWEDALEGLADITSDLVRVTGISRTLVGGGLALSGEELLAPLRIGSNARLTLHRTPEIVPATLGGLSGSWGAALLAWSAANYDIDSIAAQYCQRRRNRTLKETID